MTANDVTNAMQQYASSENAANLQRFFKTGPGQYGEGDQFIGVKVPNIRKICKQFRNLPLNEVKKLIESPVHEHRMAGLIILTMQYPKSDHKQAIYDLYMEELFNGKVNNWDLVDVTCRAVVGEHLQGNRSKLYQLAKSDNLWERRVAIISTFVYVAKGDATTSLEIAGLLLNDKHSLIQKAVGWTLREVGKRCGIELLTDFLDKHAATMPRTTLRYAVEHLPKETRQFYMAPKRNS